MTTIQLVNAAASLLFVALGILVGRLGGRTRANLAFSIFASAYGGAFLVLNLATRGVIVRDTLPAEHTPLLLAAALFATSTGALVVLALSFPAPPAAHERPRLAAALAIGLGATILFGSYNLAFGYVPASPSGVAILLLGAFLGTSVGAAALFSLRFRDAGRVEAAAYATMAAALLLNPAFLGGFVYPLQAGAAGDDAWLHARVFAAYVLPCLLVAALWLRAIATAPPGAAPGARNVAWVTMAILVAGGLAYGMRDASGDHWGFGVLRTAGVVILAYAIARGHLPGIDVKVRWAVSKSTVAAVFIAVFFVASEAAQQFFGETLGSAYVGIAAAGMLVFAIAPLQRAAERLAERAVPPASEPPSARAASAKEDAYKRAVRLALRGGITREEEVHLHEVAEHMGIGAGRAMTLRIEAERELEGDAQGVA